MEPAAFILAFVGIQALAAISPGPAFVVVTQKSLAGGQRGGLATAAGATAGVFIWLSMTMLGLELVISQFWWLYGALKILGGVFLVYLAVQLWRHAAEPLPEFDPVAAREKSLLSYFWAGLLVQLLNPKALAYCTSVLITLLPSERPLWMMIAVPVIGTIVEGTWWTFLAVAFSRGGLRRRYEGLKCSIDRVVGAALGLLSVRLLLERN